jgi:hypothetical protein
MTFEECIAYHEKDHVRRKDRPRWSRARKVPGTKNTVTEPRRPKVEMEVSENVETREADVSTVGVGLHVLNGRWTSSHGILEINGDRFVFLGGPRKDEERNAGTIIVRGNGYILRGRDTRTGLFVIKHDVLTLNQTSPSRMSQRLTRLN